MRMRASRRGRARGASRPAARAEPGVGETEDAAGIAAEDLRLVVGRQRRLDDLREQVADPASDRIRVEVAAEHDARRAELPGEVLDEVEVVAEARVEHDVRRDL